jgi:hypothetical protein
MIVVVLDYGQLGVETDRDLWQRIKRETPFLSPSDIFVFVNKADAFIEDRTADKDKVIRSVMKYTEDGIKLCQENIFFGSARQALACELISQIQLSSDGQLSSNGYMENELYKLISHWFPLSSRLPENINECFRLIDPLRDPSKIPSPEHYMETSGFPLFEKNLVGAIVQHQLLAKTLPNAFYKEFNPIQSMLINHQNIARSSNLSMQSNIEKSRNQFSEIQQCLIGRLSDLDVSASFSYYRDNS